MMTDYSRFSYVVTGHSRSGTAWVSQLLSIGDSICIHEPEALAPEHLQEVFHTYESVGCSTPSPSLTLAPIRNDRVILIERPIEECLQSFFIRMSALNSEVAMAFNQTLDFIRKRSKLFLQSTNFTYTFKFPEIFNEKTAAHLFTVCLDREPSKQEMVKIRQICKMNIQTQTLGGL